MVAVPLAAPLPFVARVGRVTAADLGRSWHRGCPVRPVDLRRVRLRFHGFDGDDHLGDLVVNAAVVREVVVVFRALYVARFPIRRMQPMAVFDGHDDRSMAADNTSGFDCRLAVTAGPSSWSMHAYGEAVDVNTVENPYFENGKVLPPNGRAYADRSRVRPGMAVPGGVLVRAFARVGWGWGGRWPASPDYQHFSVNGR